MKYLQFSVLAACVLGCQLFPDHGKKTQKVTTADTLYGFSSSDGKNYFVKVAWKTGARVILSTLDTATSATGNPVIDPNLGAYCFISGNLLVAIDVVSGSRIAAFTLPHPNTDGLVYNSNSGKLNGISSFDGQFHFVEIDITLQTMNVIQVLPPVKQYSGSSSAIDNANGKYYVMDYDTIRAIDTVTGSITNTYVLPSSLGNNLDGLRATAGGKLFGMSFGSSTGHFFSFDPATNHASILGPFQGGITGYAGVAITDGTYFYQFGPSNATVLSCIDVNTGSIINSITLAYYAYNLIPLISAGSPAD